MPLPTAPLPPDLLSSPEVFETLLDVSLTGVIFFQPVYAPDGSVTDLAYVHLNRAAQRMLQLPGRPAETFLTRYPDARQTGVFAFYRDTFLSGQAGRYDINYSDDGLDNYFHLSAQRSGEVLVVSFTDLSGDVTERVLAGRQVAQSERQVQNRNEALAVANEELRNTNEEILASNLALQRTKQQLEHLNAQLEARVAGRTAELQAAQAEAERQRQQLHTLFEQAPVAVAIFRGPEYLIELANLRIGQCWGRTHAETINKPLFEALPELKGQGIQELLDGVLRTGIPYRAEELPVKLWRDGKLETVYFNFVYQPVCEPDGTSSGIIVVANEVTGQVTSRRKVEESEEQVRAIIESAPFPIGVYLGREMRIAFSNQANLRALGKSKEVIGRLYGDVLPEFNKAQVLAQLDEVFTTGIPVHAHNVRAEVATGRNKQEFYYNYSLIPLFDPAGQVYGVMNTAVDVTEINQARKKAEESESRFRNMVEQAPVAITLTRGRDSVIESINVPMLRIMDKMQPEEVLGKKLLQVLPEIKDQPILGIVLGVLETGEPFRGNEVPVLLRAGEKLEQGYYNISYTPVLEAGKITGVLHVALDVTEQVLARRKVEDSEHRFRSLIEESPVATCLFAGRDLVIEVANEEMIGIWGKGNTVMGKPLREALPELEGQPFLQILDDVFTGGKPYQARAAEALLVKDGVPGVYYFDFTYKPLFNADGQVYGILDAAVDVTEQVLARRKIEESVQVANQLAGELAVANEELQAANAEVRSTNQELSRTNVDLDNFIYTASHDLKAPISNIEGLLAALLRTLPPESLASERVQGITAMMQASVERFKKTIGNLTEIVKLQKENSQQATQVNLPEIIREVLLDLEPVIRSSGAGVAVDVGNCPAIRFSEKNLRSVVYNLLSNAIKYRSPDRAPRVRISCRQTGAQQVFTVEDNGLGIEAGRMSQLFTMFKRFHTHVEGSGIGLYMVKKIVENAGGRIEVESQVGVGSAFRVHFPG